MAKRPYLPGELEGECTAIGWLRPSRRKPLINSTPRRGQYFWIDFPHDAYPPEFDYEHPGIVVRPARHLTDTCIIVPVTSSPPRPDAPHIHKLGANPNPSDPHKDVWAVCDHLYTVHAARLRPCRDRYERNIYPRVGTADLTSIYLKIKGSIFPVNFFDQSEDGLKADTLAGSAASSISGTSKS
jgi:uncharacterized protein YifN (PemK superfamily)